MGLGELTEKKMEPGQVFNDFHSAQQKPSSVVSVDTQDESIPNYGYLRSDCMKKSSCP